MRNIVNDWFCGTDPTKPYPNPVLPDQTEDTIEDFNDEIIGEEGFVDGLKKIGNTFVNALRLYRNTIGVGLHSWRWLFTYNYKAFIHGLATYPMNHPIEDNKFAGLHGKYINKRYVDVATPLLVLGSKVIADGEKELSLPLNKPGTPKIDQVLTGLTKLGFTYDITTKKCKIDNTNIRQPTNIVDMGYGRQCTPFCRNQMTAYDKFADSLHTMKIYFQYLETEKKANNSDRKLSKNEAKNMQFRINALYCVGWGICGMFNTLTSYGFQLPLTKIGYLAGMEKDVFTKNAPPKGPQS